MNERPFTLLRQETYNDHGGQDILASAVEVLAPYSPPFDGFHTWECGACRHIHHDRSCGWPIAGQVLECAVCKKMNLLVRTDCAAIDELAMEKWRSEERDRENERLRGIKQYNDEAFRRIRSDLVSRIEVALANE